MPVEVGQFFHTRAQRAQRAQRDWESNEISEKIIGAAIQVHRTLGPGLLESTCEACLKYELEKRGLKVLYQVGLPVIYDGMKIDSGYRVDISLMPRSGVDNR